LFTNLQFWNDYLDSFLFFLLYSTPSSVLFFLFCFCLCLFYSFDFLNIKFVFCQHRSLFIDPPSIFISVSDCSQSAVNVIIKLFHFGCWDLLIDENNIYINGNVICFLNCFVCHLTESYLQYNVWLFVIYITRHKLYLFWLFGYVLHCYSSVSMIISVFCFYFVFILFLFKFL